METLLLSFPAMDLNVVVMLVCKAAASVNVNKTMKEPVVLVASPAPLRSPALPPLSVLLLFFCHLR